MERAYGSYLALIAKVRGLAGHRSIRGDNGDASAKKLNAFIDRMAEELVSCHAVPGQVVEDEAPTFNEFLSG